MDCVKATGNVDGDIMVWVDISEILISLFQSSLSANIYR